MMEMIVSSPPPRLQKILPLERERRGEEERKRELVNWWVDGIGGTCLSLRWGRQENPKKEVLPWK
jgi:hypothetical protein